MQHVQRVVGGGGGGGGVKLKSGANRVKAYSVMLAFKNELNLYL